MNIFILAIFKKMSSNFSNRGSFMRDISRFWRGARALGRARLIMLCGACLIACVSVCLSFGDGAAYPFGFNLFMGAGAIGAYAAFLAIFDSRLIFGGATWRRALRRAPSIGITLGVASNFNYLFFARAASFLNVAIVVSLFELWPLIALACDAALNKRNLGLSLPSRGMAALLSLGALGAGFALASQTGGFDYGGAAAMAAGGGLALAGAALGGAGVSWELRWAREMRGALRDDADSDHSEIGCIAMTYLLTNAIALAPKAALLVAAGEDMALAPSAFGAGAGIVMGLAAICWRRANLAAGGGVNAIWQISPLLSAGALWALSRVDVARMEYLLAGAALIALANAGALRQDRYKMK